MQSIVVVNNPKDFNFDIPGVEVVAARSYLTEEKYAEMRNVRIYNLCKSYRYQSIGYYVSLLAEARDHRVFPCITTIQDLKSQVISRIISDDIDHLIQKSLAKIKSKTFVLSIYFGKNIAKHYDTLSKQLANLFQAPLLQATFVLNKKWLLQNITPLPITEIPDNHHEFVLECAKEYFARKRIRTYRKNSTIFDLAILVNPHDFKNFYENSSPSDELALKRFCEAAEQVGFSTEYIHKDDFSRIPEFDALFIRETTAVNHHTYRFARRAHAEGLVVIDDPSSIVKCTNKVYLYETLAKAKIATPKTMVIHKYNKHTVADVLGLPCVLKQPDSSCSQGVVKVEDIIELEEQVERLLNNSDLIIAQEFTPTKFDWRIGVLDKKPLFACKYYMVDNHWQITAIKNKNFDDGRRETLPISAVPPKVLDTALKSANLIGNSLYGVDIKQHGNKVTVIEVNDNPSLEADVEDAVLKEKLYLTLAHSFMDRIKSSKMRKS